jgi:2-keto-4-pentenoate hydratase/2-oxohepta-3-ene-1,7-dioic acid hydratase in catechol pathway
MKIVRFAHEGSEHYGILEGNEVRLASGSPFDRLVPGSRTLPLSKVALLAPCSPSKALCIGLNYRDHAIEFNLPIPTTPVVFIKPSTCVPAPGGLIEKPAMSARLDYEAELVVVIGKKARHVPAEKAADYILGYTCGNDVTARDLQPKDGQWTVAKSFDTFLPFGPWIETELDPGTVGVRAILNGVEKQRSSTANLIFPVPELVAYLSEVMTLLPGDIIMTGTPSGVGPMNSGDEIVIDIEGIGRLSNRVR